MLVENVKTAVSLERPDEQVLADVGDRLWQDNTARALERSALSVEVHNGEVFLAGHVTNQRYRRHVVQLVRGVRGVQAVHDALVSDPDLLTEVAQALAADPRTGLAVLGVGAFHGWIHLTGTVPDLATRLAAEEVAARVPGVRGVLSLPHLPHERADRGENRRPLQPQQGKAVYASDGRAGLVEQVIISPASRLVSHIVVGGTVEVDWLPIRGHWVVPVEAVTQANEGGVFLSESLAALAARPAQPASSAAGFRLPPAGWQPPFPYHAGDVRWLCQDGATPTTKELNVEASDIILADQRPDVDIEADARQAISTLDTANATGLEVEVSVRQGQVTLTGYMRSGMIAPGIERVVRGIAGTRSIVNHLVDDSALVRKLAAALALDDRTRAIPPGYQVVSALGRAMVVGDFGSEARAAVAQVCAGVAGVRSVEIRAIAR